MASLRCQGLPHGIDPDQPLKNYNEAMSRPDREHTEQYQWAAVYQKECRGFVDRKALDVVKFPKGARALGTTTRLEALDYNMEKLFQKYSEKDSESPYVRTRGSTKKEWISVHLTSTRRFLRNRNGQEATLLAAISAEPSCLLVAVTEDKYKASIPLHRYGR